MPTHGDMTIETVVVGPFEVNSYILWNESRRALVIDPGADVDLIAGALAENRLSVAAYLLTHGHVDHVSALADLYRRFPGEIAIPAADARWAFTERGALPPFYPAPEKPGAPLCDLEDGQELSYGGMQAVVISTPGHSPGGVCFHYPAQKVLFAGDTLFRESVGRTDLPGGDSRMLSASLRKLAALPDDTTVYPGHGPATTIGHEKSHNFFMQRM